MTTLITFIQRAIMQGIPLLYGSTGEILTEKSYGSTYYQGYHFSRPVCLEDFKKLL